MTDYLEETSVKPGEYDEFLRRKVDAGRASICAGQWAANDEVEEFATVLKEPISAYIQKHFPELSITDDYVAGYVNSTVELMLAHLYERMRQKQMQRKAKEISDRFPFKIEDMGEVASGCDEDFMERLEQGHDMTDKVFMKVLEQGKHLEPFRIVNCCICLEPIYEGDICIEHKNYSEGNDDMFYFQYAHWPCAPREW